MGGAGPAGARSSLCINTTTWGSASGPRPSPARPAAPHPGLRGLGGWGWERDEGGPSHPSSPRARLPLHRCTAAAPWVAATHPTHPPPRFALPSGPRSPKDSLPSQAPNTAFRGDTSGMGVLPSTTTPPRKEKKKNPFPARDFKMCVKGFLLHNSSPALPRYPGGRLVLSIFPPRSAFTPPELASEDQGERLARSFRFGIDFWVRTCDSVPGEVSLGTESQTPLKRGSGIRAGGPSSPEAA